MHNAADMLPMASSSCRRGEPISHSALVLALYRPVCVAFNLVAAVQLWKRGQLLVHQLLPQIQTEIVQKFSSLRQQSGRLVLNPEGRSKLQQVEQSPALLTTFLCHLPRFAIPFPFWQNDTRSVCLRVCGGEHECGRGEDMLTALRWLFI